MHFDMDLPTGVLMSKVLKNANQSNKKEKSVDTTIIKLHSYAIFQIKKKLM